MNLAFRTNSVPPCCDFLLIENGQLIIEKGLGRSLSGAEAAVYPFLFNCSILNSLEGYVGVFVKVYVRNVVH